jgi:hypothetical protein
VSTWSITESRPLALESLEVTSFFFSADYSLDYIFDEDYYTGKAEGFLEPIFFASCFALFLSFLSFSI